jgi:hypothetical protein
MRELREAYERANACVACHQNVAPDILSAGHPELIFELDGQCASEPRHWQEQRSHGQLWLVGQAVALREMIAQLSALTNDQPRLRLRTEALAWLLPKIISPEASAFPKAVFPLTAQSFAGLQSAADSLAQSASREWNTNVVLLSVRAISALAPEFRDKQTTAETHARRAERLVLALDRLILDLPSADRVELNPQIDRLFQLSQNIPEFAPAQFSDELEQVRKKLVALESR